MKLPMDRILFICGCYANEEDDFHNHTFCDDAIFVHYEEGKKADEEYIWTEIQADSHSLEFLYLDKDIITGFYGDIPDRGNARMIYTTDGQLPLNEESLRPQLDSVIAHLRDPEIEYDSKVIFEGFIWGIEGIGLPMLYSWSCITEAGYDLPSNYSNCIIYYFSD
jgi:hypothetical protein